MLFRNFMRFIFLIIASTTPTISGFGTVVDLDYSQLTPDKQVAPVVMDGAIGTLLGQLGWDLDKDPLWGAGALLDRFDLVQRVHEEYIDAGARIIETNTYQASAQAHRDRGATQHQVEVLFDLAVEAAQDAIEKSGESVTILGAIGPYATYLRDGSEYNGSYVKGPNFREQTIIDYYLEQARPLILGGARVLNFETIPSLKEVQLVGRVLDRLHLEGMRQVTAWVSCACRDEVHTNAGDKFADVVRFANAHPLIVAIGINCTAPQHVSGLLDEARRARNRKPLAVYPNSGETYNARTRRFEHGEGAPTIADLVPRWYAQGARIFGGCCRVDPEQIEDIAEVCEKIGEDIKKAEEGGKSEKN